MKLKREKTAEQILKAQEKQAQKALEKQIKKNVNKALSKHKRHKTASRYTITFLLALVVVLSCVLYFSASQNETHTSTYGKQPLLGNHSAEIIDLVVSETRKENKLIVQETDLVCKDKIDDALFDIDLFKKSQEITFYGTADYTVDLSQLTTSSIQIDDSNNTITINVPHASLNNVTVDFEKTEFSEIERGFLGWGSIKLKPEEQNALEQTMHKTMIKEASKKEHLQQADTFANEALTSLITKILTPYQDYNPTIVIQFKEYES